MKYVKATLPNGKWAHRKPTEDENRVRRALAPWANSEEDAQGNRITLKKCLARLHGGTT